MKPATARLRAFGISTSSFQADIQSKADTKKAKLDCD
jgi:hypothetical protein